MVFCVPLLSLNRTALRVPLFLNMCALAEDHGLGEAGNSAQQRVCKEGLLAFCDGAMLDF
jgi:hypothetical protein